MQKTELMKEYEIKIDSVVNWEANPIGYAKYLESELIKERAKPTITYQAVETFQEIIRNQCDEITALKEKAEAYDRLMSGGVITKKDVANVFGKVLVMTPNGYWQLWFSKPRRDKWGWHLDGGDTKSIGHTIAHFSDLNIIHDGSWQASLTLPDGWEES